MAAEPAELAADSQPYSPSDFLNLPPTPRFDIDYPALQLQLQDDDDDDLVLPFISRVLMEEETDSFFEQYQPDHPALLQAQQPFADILSDAAASTFTTLPPASAAATPAFANATWPYEPVELSQLLLSRTYPANTARYDSPASSSSTMLGDGTVVNMDMLNLAFLKGMEEASKFLPAATNSSLLLKPIVSGSGNGDHGRNQPNKVWKPQVDGNVKSSLLLQQSATNNGGSRGRKNNRHADDSEDDDDDETTGRRSRKLIAAETEESEMVDEFVQSGYQSLHEQMRAMAISSDDGDKKSATSRKGKGSANEAVDLRTLLIHCAQAVAAGDRPSATDLLSRIRERSSPRGDATQRLAHCFAKGLEARLAGTGTQVYESLLANSKRASSTVEFLKAYQLYLAACCFTAMAFKFSNMAICKAIVGRRKKVHIVDYGHHYGFQWPTLLGYWGNMEGGPPEVRITAIGLPEPGFRPAARLQQTGRRLTNFARRHGVPFRFHSIAAAKWETVSVDDLDIEHDEVLVVNGLFHFSKLMDEGADIDSLSPRDMVLGNICKMRPDVFILCIDNSSCNAPFFVTRFREALFYYSAMFDMMDALAPRDNDERVLVEQEFFGRCALNAIACEGSQRVERPEMYRQWQVRNERAGLRQLPLNPDAVKSISSKVEDQYHKDFVIDVDQQWLLQGWKGRILYAMSTWVANDNTTHDL